MLPTFEPATFWSPVGCTSNWATEAAIAKIPVRSPCGTTQTSATTMREARAAPRTHNWSPTTTIAKIWGRLCALADPPRQRPPPHVGSGQPHASLYLRPKPTNYNGKEPGETVRMHSPAQESTTANSNSRADPRSPTVTLNAHPNQGSHLAMQLEWQNNDNGELQFGVLEKLYNASHTEWLLREAVWSKRLKTGRPHGCNVKDVVLPFQLCC